MARQTIMCQCGVTVVIEANDDDAVVAALQEKGWYARMEGESLIRECPDCNAKTEKLVEEQGW